MLSKSWHCQDQLDNANANARLSGENKKGNVWIALQKRKLELVGVGKLIIDHSPAAGSRRWIIIPPHPQTRNPNNGPESFWLKQLEASDSFVITVPSTIIMVIFHNLLMRTYVR